VPLRIVGFSSRNQKKKEISAMAVIGLVYG
jgi:hypothetical protein